jgi:hypothetical protein
LARRPCASHALAIAQKKTYKLTISAWPFRAACFWIAGFPPQTAKRWPGFRHKPRNQNLCGEIRLKQAGGRCLAVFESPGLRIGMDVMLSDHRHWLEYDSVALAVLLVGIGLVELIVLRI